jgi:hypothetical protein
VCLGELFEKAREKVKEDGYEYKRGYSRSGSSSSSSEISDHTSTKEKGKSTKRKHTDAEERQKAISNIKALIESTQDHVRIKQLRIQKLKACNDFRQCDVITSEMTKLMRQKHEYESQLAVLERKEAKSHWYKKKSKRKPAPKASESHTQPSIISLMGVPSETTSASASASVSASANGSDSVDSVDSAHSAQSADTLILDDSNTDHFL